MSAGVGLEREMCQAGEGTERLLQESDQCQRTLHGGLGLQRVQVLELWQGSYLLIELGVVLHRTRPQRIEARIDAEVTVREVGIMAHHRQFVALRQLCILGTAHRGRYLVTAETVRGQTVAFAPLAGALKNQAAIQFMIHRAAMFTKLSISSFVRFSVTAMTRPSPTGTPPRMPASTKRRQRSATSPS